MNNARVTDGATSLDDGFVEPPWRASLDVARELAAVPSSAQISGMFIAPMVAEIKRLGLSKLLTRDRYVGFQFYPLREHMQLMAAMCEALYADRSLRAALRKLGRGAPVAFVGSTLGRVVFGSANGVQECIDAFARGYALNMRPGNVSVLEHGRNRSIVRLEDIYSFLDSHHVGAFEGVMRHAGANGRVRIKARGPGKADLLLEWA